MYFIYIYICFIYLYKTTIYIYIYIYIYASKKVATNQCTNFSYVIHSFNSLNCLTPPLPNITYNYVSIKVHYMKCFVGNCFIVTILLNASLNYVELNIIITP